MYEELIQKIKALGLDDQKATELFDLLSGEILTAMFRDLAEVLTEEELQVYENRIREAKSSEHFQTIINEIALKAYGDNAEATIKENYEALIEEMKKSIEQARTLIQSQNPDDQALLQKAQQAQEYQDIISSQQQAPTSTDGPS